jgi:hypothetical protein
MPGSGSSEEVVIEQLEVEEPAPKSSVWRNILTKAGFLCCSEFEHETFFCCGVR